MTGSHIVKAFYLKDGGEIHVPEGWKPFAYDPATHAVICRKWVRSEKENQSA